MTTKFVIGKDERVATAGSCFAQHISNRLAKIGFNYFVPESGEHLPANQRHDLNYGVFSARFGNLYTTRQLLQLFQECFEGRSVTEGVWQRSDGQWVDALRPQVTPGGYGSAEEVRAERKSHLAAVCRMFAECDFFVFTLGLTEAWRSRIDDTVYPVAPGVSGGCFDPDRHEFVNFDVRDVMADLDEFLTSLKAINAQVKVILTVSPVPLIATCEARHVLVSTTYSKSVLRVAADEACRKYDWVDYFPSYEIITGNFNNSAYYEADYRGINVVGVDHAMRCFLSHYTEGSCNDRQAPTTYAAASAGSDVICDEETIDQLRV
ncbi:MAG: GSCFA domain-containing protein [Desulfuromonadales bacterium]|nr:GSCFA domain-containing protein [Desulfuromonadales bacterium]